MKNNSSIKNYQSFGNSNLNIYRLNKFSNVDYNPINKSSVYKSASKPKYNNFHSEEKKISGVTTKLKIDTIKVCVRVRPLLEHEDSEFWMPDLNENIITTIE